MAIMAQQRQFIHKMYNSGVLSDAEKMLMEEVLPSDRPHTPSPSQCRSAFTL